MSRPRAVAHAGAEARAGRFPGPSLIPDAPRDPARARLAAARGARDARARAPPAAVRDRGPDLVLPALPHLAAAGCRGRRAATTCPAGCAAPTSACEQLRAARRDPDIEVREVSCLGRCDIRRRVAPSVDEPRPSSGAATARCQRAERPVRPRRTRTTACCATRLPASATRPSSSRRSRSPGCAAWAAPASRPGRSGSWSPSRRPRRSTRSATPTSPSRAPSRTARSWPSSRTWCSRACCSAMLAVGAERGLGLHPARVRAARSDVLRAELERLRGRGPARTRHGVAVDDLHLPRRLHPRRGDGAARVHGGPPRRAAQQAAVPGRATACGASRR